MGAGYHGGFGSTSGSISVVAADSTLVGNGRGFELKEAAKRVKKKLKALQMLQYMDRRIAFQL